MTTAKGRQQINIRSEVENVIFKVVSLVMQTVRSSKCLLRYFFFHSVFSHYGTFYLQ